MGVDASPSGWVAALLRNDSLTFELRAFSRLEQVLEPGPAVVALDMIIGLPDAAAPGGRECDRQARRLLGRRGSSVFSPPCRPALAARSYPEALTANRAKHGVGLSKQAYNLFPKLRQADALLTPALQAIVHEAHPELAFAGMASGTPCAHAKKQSAGRTERLERLASQGFDAAALHAALGLECRRQLGAAADDILDALACAWTAKRIASGTAKRLPHTPPKDSRGLRMEVWF